MSTVLVYPAGNPEKLLLFSPVRPETSIAYPDRLVGIYCGRDWTGRWCEYTYTWDVYIEKRMAGRREDVNCGVRLSCHDFAGVIETAVDTTQPTIGSRQLYIR